MTINKTTMLKNQTDKTSINKDQTKNFKIAIVKTNYYIENIALLEKYAVLTLAKNGVLQKNIKSFTAPGSWEIPLLVQRIALSKKFDAIIALGIIIKGDTYHFEMIANECARGLMQISLDHNIPIAIEVLAVYNKKQAEERAGDNGLNKGVEAATAVLKTLLEINEIEKNK
jgi:6,7-dimethyl-8-ribityllumazine synthase